MLQRPLLLLLATATAVPAGAQAELPSVQQRPEELLGTTLDALRGSVEGRLNAAGISALSAVKPAPPGPEMAQWLNFPNFPNFPNFFNQYCFRGYWRNC